MQDIWMWVLFLVGIVLIVKGGDYFVDAASFIAEVLQIPKFIIGATVVSLATTLPEIIVSLMAATSGNVDMAIGNAVGSVTANTGLILGILVAAAPPMIKRRELLPKGLMMLGATAILWGLSQHGELTVLASMGLLAVFILFIYENIVSGKKQMDAAKDQRPDTNKKTITINILKFLVGAVGIVVGARLLVDNGSAIATQLGVPERIISLTMLAIGTSLPELVTTITALVKKQSDLSVGNILGANIIDIAIILPLCAVFSGGALPMPRTSLVMDIPVCLGIGIIAIVPTLVQQRFRRWQGITMLLLYVAYIVVLIINPFKL